jgi:biopolymer transport protein ExbD
MSMSTSSGGAEEAVPYINVTPLIDVLLVLLIIFMVISPLKPSRFEAKVPSEPEPNKEQNLKPNPLTLVVTIGSDEKMKLNNEDMGAASDTSTLSARLVAEFKKRAENKAYRTGTTIVETTVFVKAPRNMAYGKIVKVIDALKGAGADPVGLQIDDLQ